MKAVATFFLVASALLTAFCAFHVFVDRGGAISAREAQPFMLLGGVLFVISLIVVAASGSKKPAAHR